jgi:CheY-like chemotaxis protein
MTKRILVVEDQEDNRQILRDLLVHAGYEVHQRTVAKKLQRPFRDRYRSCHSQQ